MSNDEIEIEIEINIDISNSDDENHESQDVRKFICSLKNVNWNIKKDRYQIICQLYHLMSNWKGNFSDLRVIFRFEEIEYLLFDVIIDGEHKDIRLPFIRFVVESGYKDKPRLDKDGKPILLRTTPLHWLFRKYLMAEKESAACELFKIYNRYDLNYTDETGLTHFHVACEFGVFDVVEKFLDLGQDPNRVWTRTGDSPLYLALKRDSGAVALTLLARGADPNLTNKREQTALHAIFQRPACIPNDNEDAFMRIFLETCEANHRPVSIDARDKFGNRPLHLALGYQSNEIRPKTAELLLRMGADPNSANAEGSTPLHVLSKRYQFFSRDDLPKSYFSINDEMNQTLRVDAKDKLGRTPLQWAVANIYPQMAEVLLDRGADMSSFVFPTKNYFGKVNCVMNNYTDDRFFHVSNLLALVECLEKGGYELDRSEALLIMKHFAEYGFFKSSVNCECWRGDEMLIRYEESYKLISPSLSLGDLIQLRPEEAQEQIRCTGYFQFLPGWVNDAVPDACLVHLCEIMWRGFFRRWAIYPFWELIHYRLPLEMCEMIIDGLMNKDLYHIFLAATIKINKKNSTENVVTIEQCNTKRPVRVKKYPKMLCNPRHSNK